MTADLRSVVALLGGDVYAGGTRANVPAPGHSAGDRSVSLLLTGDRIVIHGFGEADWRAVRDHLRDRGLIDAHGRLVGAAPGALGPAGGGSVRPDTRLRLAAAASLWRNAEALASGQLSVRHLAFRGLPGISVTPGLRHHRAAPLSVYRPGYRTRPALVARIDDAAGRLTAVEVVYLDPNGRQALGLAVARKTVGRVPPGSAVRLATPAKRMLVAEGVMTTLSAMRLFGLPGWALGSAHNLSAWTPPAEARRILIAADRGAVGEGAADRLRRRLEAIGLSSRIVSPPEPFGDWNESLCGVRGGGRVARGAGAAGMGPVGRLETHHDRP
jgi:putative DNA primase/helicase